MNYVSKIKKHMGLVEEAYGGIVTEQARGKAGEVIREAVGRMGFDAMGSKPMEKPVIGDSVASGKADACGEGIPARVEPRPVELKGTGFPGVEVTSRDGVTFVRPLESVVSVEVVGDVEKAEYESVGVVPEWPEAASVTVGSRCVNPKLLSGRLGDGRKVSLEKGWRNYKVGDVVKGELVRGGGSPLYRVEGTRV